MTTYTAEQIVKYAHPIDKQEAALRFTVIEDRDTRLLVGVIGAQGLGITQCHAKSEYILAD